MQSPQQVRAAALQLSSGAEVGRNLEIVDGLLAEAASQDVMISFLPENFAIMGAADEDKVGHAEDPGQGPIQDTLADAARRHGMWIVAGSLPLKSPAAGKCFGASMVFDADGNASSVYRKIHLFDVDLPDSDEQYRESATMHPGDEIVVVDSPIGRLGLTICYDLRFPELFRRLVDEGATAFSVPAAFTLATGKAHWHTLLRARAVENLAYVIAAAQHGSHPNGRITYGHSAIVAPWGQIIAEKAAGDGIVVADIDPDKPRQLRRDFPVLKHRKM
ncbi:MAG: carbon-nitrogen hydrolase family protein [Woeseiaceae bacterium]|nr:carbon-nitrogen hydrolase family protein [Woeseiaceae bacterium]